MSHVKHSSFMALSDSEFKTYAENLFNQLKELLKDKTLKDITDIRGANIGVSTQNESLPIIFDF